jgi:hypothetical protein
MDYKFNYLNDINYDHYEIYDSYESPPLFHMDIRYEKVWSVNSVKTVNQ